MSQAGTFNTVNELTARDRDSNSTNGYTRAYDAVGNMSDDGEKYTYVYDAFGRLVTVKNRSTSAVVAEYKYNGLNQRIGSHDETDAGDRWIRSKCRLDREPPPVCDQPRWEAEDCDDRVLPRGMLVV